MNISIFPLSSRDSPLHTQSTMHYFLHLNLGGTSTAPLEQLLADVCLSTSPPTHGYGTFCGTAMPTPRPFWVDRCWVVLSGPL